MEEGERGGGGGRRGIPVPRLESDGKSDLAHAALCQNSPVLPSSGQIFQEITAAEPRGKGRSSAARTRANGAPSAVTVQTPTHNGQVAAGHAAPTVVLDQRSFRNQPTARKVGVPVSCQVQTGIVDWIR